MTQLRKEVRVDDLVYVDSDLAKVLRASKVREGRFEVMILKRAAKSYRRDGDRGLFIDVEDGKIIA